MPGGQHFAFGAGDGIGEGGGGARRHDMIVLGDDHQGWRRDGFRSHRLTIDPPGAFGRRVVHVPADQAFPGHRPD